MVNYKVTNNYRECQTIITPCKEGYNVIITDWLANEEIYKGVIPTGSNSPTIEVVSACHEFIDRHINRIETTGIVLEK